MDVQHEFEFEYTFDAAFVRKALQRDLAWRGAYATAAFGILLLGLWLWIGHLSGTILAIVGVGLVLLWVLLFRVWRTGAARIVELWSRLSPERTQRFLLDDEGLEVHLGESSSRYAWKGLRRLWRYSDVWLLEIVKNTSVFFPPDAAPEDARAFIIERCRAAGVRT